LTYINFIQNHSSLIWEYAGNHFSLVFTAVLVSLLIWIPVGILLSNCEKTAGIMLGIADTIFCIPSLALFSVFVTVSFLGLGRRSALLALVLYAMMPLIRNTYQGINGVDKSVIEAAKGMGMNSRTILKEVQLPLAAPVIFAGFRITVVLTTGTAAIAAYIGERNLGRFITEGLMRGDVEMIVVGALIIAFIAIFFDTVLGFFEKLMVPKGLRISRNN